MPIFPLPDESGTLPYLIASAAANESANDKITAWGTLAAAVIAAIATLLSFLTLRSQRRDRLSADRAKASRVHLLELKIDRQDAASPEQTFTIREAAATIYTEHQLIEAHIVACLKADRSKSVLLSGQPVTPGHAVLRGRFDPPLVIPVVLNQNIPDLFETTGPLCYTDFDGGQWQRVGFMPPIRKGHASSWIGRSYDWLIARFGLVRIR